MSKKLGHNIFSYGSRGIDKIVVAKKKFQDSQLEDKLKNLENIVEQLEKGNLGLEQNLEIFEKGISLFKSCRKQINTFEKKINKLTDDLKEEKIDLD